MATSYAWARGISSSFPGYSTLSEEEISALSDAELLAEAAQARRLAAIGRSSPDYELVTLAELAREAGVPAATLRGRIARTRGKLFGDLTDRAIRYRKARVKERRAPAESPRRCRHCRKRLPSDAHPNRRYCDEHAKPKWKMQRLRAKKTAGKRRGA